MRLLTCCIVLQSSVRHNLSSNRAFKKLDRGPDERGKGALWSVDPMHEHLFEEQDARKQAEGKLFGKKSKDVALLGPPLRRSIKGEPKGTPLPPPLTSAPLVKREFHNTNISSFPPVHTPVKQEPSPALVLATSPPTSTPASFSSIAAVTHAARTKAEPSPPLASTTTEASASTSSRTPSSIPPIPPSVRLPIIIGPVPASSSDASSNPADAKPIVLHQNSLILNPTIFAHLTSEQLRDLEALGAQKALEILQGYIVRYYKEKLRAEGGRGRGRGRGRKLRGGAPSTARPTSTPDGLFTTTPLPMRTAKPEGQDSATPGSAEVSAAPSSSEPPMASLQPAGEPEAPDSPIIIVDDDDEENSDSHISKRPRLGETGSP